MRGYRKSAFVFSAVANISLLSLVFLLPLLRYGLSPADS